MYNNDNKKAIRDGLSVFLLKHPYILLILLIVFLIFAVILISTGMFTSNDFSISEDALDEFYQMCTPKDQLDQEEFYQNYTMKFTGMGELDGEGSLFYTVATEYNIDPVLFASIVFYETNEGTSELLKKNNNVGRMIDSDTGDFIKFNSLASGVEAFAKFIFEEYIDQGIVTINQIGQKRAPLQDENGSTFNTQWIPKVTEYARDLFGGLILNCDEVNFGSGQFARPIPNSVITSNYGVRIDPFTGRTKYHKGIDFGAPRGTHIYSAEAGKVVDVVKGCREGVGSCGGGYGNRVLIKHNEGLYTLYAHMTDVYVNLHDTVSRSQKIGTVGSTGRSTGPHLHFEVQLSPFGERVDPMSYLSYESF